MRLPDGASTDRTDAAAKKIESVIGKLPGVDKYFVLGGLDIATGTSNSNVATVIATLKPWDERTSKDTQLDAILAGSAARVRAGSGSLHVRLRTAADSRVEPHRRISVHAGRSRRRRHRDPGARRRYPDRRGPQAAGAGYGDQHLPALGARLLHRHGYRQAPDDGDLADRRLQHAADLSRRTVRQRLQPVRPYLAGTAAGGARVPRSSPRRWAASTCAIRAAAWCRSPPWPPSRRRADPT